ncbi:hypothetical protein ATCC90586_008267 [Pythium insidiosum]|nr:hypothetical protein ATCC90586_008267 [Pythium insidiosum]
MNITSVISEDLLFFSNLRRLDISDNEAPFEPFSSLPQLVELDIQCNALQNVVVGNGFQQLEVLNASFNCLTSKDIDQLSTLLRIRELYVSHNWIRTLPPVMDRFSRLETLSLEQNGITGDEVFNFLAIMPRLRNLNLSHNKLTAFPEAALSVQDKRGAGFYSLVYLNLAYNKVTNEDDIVLLTELHSLRKLVLYGNPLVHAAVSSQDPTQLNYDPVPNLTSQILESGRDLAVICTYPESQKNQRGKAKHSMTTGSYDNVEIYKMLPTEVPLPSPFRSRATNFLLPAEPERKKKNELSFEVAQTWGKKANVLHALSTIGQ